MGSNFFRKGLTVTQLTPRWVWKFKRSLSLVLKGDFHFYNKKETVNLPARLLTSFGIGFSIERKNFFNPSVWVYTGRRIFSYQGRLIENHHQEHRMGLILKLDKKAGKNLKVGACQLYEQK